MRTKLLIDNEFISKWHPQYDNIWKDELKYQQIVDAVHTEISQQGTITKPTFLEILKWKTRNRIKHLINWTDFDNYARRVEKCLTAQDEHKLAILAVPKSGIGVPVASAILHFVYPDHFPIMDQRTVEVLQANDYIESKQRDQKRYSPFRSAILAIAQQFPKWSLRQIDRALMAYHKKEFEPKTRAGKETPKECLSHVAERSPHKFVDEAGKTLQSRYGQDLIPSYELRRLIERLGRYAPGSNYPQTIVTTSLTDHQYRSAIIYLNGSRGDTNISAQITLIRV